MTLTLAAKSTKPGSKANSKRDAGRNSRPARVPVGTLHLIDDSTQSPGAMFEAVCGETSLVAIDGAWDDGFANDRCDLCADQHWAAEFGEMQSKLLP